MWPLRNPRRSEAAASDLYFTSAAPAGDPGWEGGLVKQITEEGKRGRGVGDKKSPNPARINSYTHIHLQSSQLFPSLLYRFNQEKGLLKEWLYVSHTVEP